MVIYDLRLAIYEFNIGLQYSCARAECHAIANLTANFYLWNYRVVYRFRREQKTVEILRVWHGARGEPEL
jgi:plasmid stabilization system protein ParE